MADKSEDAMSVIAWSDTEDYDGGEDYEDDLDTTQHTNNNSLLDQKDSIGPTWNVPPPIHYSASRTDEGQLPLDAEEARCCRQIYRDHLVLDNSAAAASGPRFRLLQINPGVRDSPISGKLITRPVFDAPEYIALSYSWGARNYDRHISIGTVPTFLFMSVHLWEALNHIRQEREIITVWVDAICINQDNLLEKASQIQIMAQIYNQAREVRAWLGILPELSQQDITELMFFSRLCRVKQPWWKRLWVVQECAFAKECPIIMFGDQIMSLQALVLRWTELVASLTEVPGNSADSSLSIHLLVDNLEFLRLLYDTWLAQSEELTHQQSLLARLRQTARHEYTVQHDKIYALLNIIQEQEAKLIAPDYSTPYDRLMDDVMTVLWRDPSLFKSADDARLVDLTAVVGPQPAPSVPNHTDWSTKLVERVSNCDIDAVRELLDQPPQRTSRYRAPVNADVCSEMLCEALIGAVVRDFSDIVQLLLDQGANPTLGESQFQAKPGRGRWIYGNALEIASGNGNHRIVRLLIDHVNRIGLCVPSYDRMLELAISEHKVECIKLLFDLQVVDDIEAHWHAEALYAAYRGDSSNAIDHLSHINREFRDDALHMAVLADQVPTATRLHEAGAWLTPEVCHVEMSRAADEKNFKMLRLLFDIALKCPADNFFFDELVETTFNMICDEIERLTSPETSAPQLTLAVRAKVDWELDHATIALKWEGNRIENIIIVLEMLESIYLAIDAAHEVETTLGGG